MSFEKKAVSVLKVRETSRNESVQNTVTGMEMRAGLSQFGVSVGKITASGMKVGKANWGVLLYC